MKIASPIHHKKARFEIIPLIDIMFFLLASFMMVSLTMFRVEAVRMDLPTPTAASPGKKPEMVHIEVDSVGDAHLVVGSDRQRKSLPDLFSYLTNRFAANTNLPAYIKGDPASTHGQVIAVLDTCRRAGIHKVSFNITLPAKK